MLQNEIVELFKNTLYKKDKQKYDTDLEKVILRLNYDKENHKCSMLQDGRCETCEQITLAFKILNFLNSLWNIKTSKERGFTPVRKKTFDFIISYQKKYNRLPKNIEIARAFGVTRQRITELMKWLNDNGKITLWQKMRKYIINKPNKK